MIKKINYFIFGLFIALFFASNSRAESVATTVYTGTCSYFSVTQTLEACASAAYNYLDDKYSSVTESLGYEITRISSSQITFKVKYVENGNSSYQYAYLRDLVKTYTCGDGYTLNDDGLTCSSSVPVYVLDNDAIAAYEEKTTSLKNTSLITDGDLSLLESEILAQQTKQDSTLSALSQANSDLTSSSNLLSNAQDLATANPDSTTINSNLNTISSLFNDSVDDYQSAYDDAKNVVDSTASNVALISQSKDLNNDNSDLLVLVDDSVDGIKTCDDYECWNSKKIDIDDNLGKIETNNATIEENKNTITNNTNTINNKTESSISNSKKVTNNYTSINNITNNSSSAAANGETCVGDECVETPDSTDVSQTPINDIPVGESFYTSAYEDGFQGVFDKKITALKATEFYGAAQNFVFTGTGSVPNWSISVGNYGSFDLSLSSDIWDFIKICFLITTGFLCRRLVFGG